MDQSIHPLPLSLGFIPSLPAVMGNEVSKGPSVDTQAELLKKLIKGQSHTRSFTLSLEPASRSGAKERRLTGAGRFLQ